MQMVVHKCSEKVDLYLKKKQNKTRNALEKYMNKQILVYSYNGIALSNEKEWTIDILNNTDESQSNVATWGKPDKEGMLTVGFHSYETNSE